MEIALFARSAEREGSVGSHRCPAAEEIVLGWVGAPDLFPLPAVLLAARGRCQPSRQRFVAGRRVRPSGALDIRASSAARAPRRSLGYLGLLRFPADRIHKGVIEALTPGALEAYEDDAAGGTQRFPLAGRSSKDCITGTIGFRATPSEAIRKLLARSGPLAIKAHFALWARQFAESEDTPGAPVSLTLSRFCDDLGFARLQNGAHRPEHKRQAALLLELLTTLELDAEYRAPDGRTTRLCGPLWRQTVLDGELTLAPGEWFGDPLWREFNAAVGLVGDGLLKLRQDRDRWTLCVGGYLATLARMNGYRPLTLRLTTLEERSGLLRAERRNPARRHETLERALDRCVEAGLISAWEYATPPGSEPDMDSPDELSTLAAALERPEDRRVVVHWSPALQGREAKLQAARDRHRRRLRRTASAPSERARR